MFCDKKKYAAWQSMQDLEEQFLHIDQNFSRILLPQKFFFLKKQSDYKPHEVKIMKHQKLQASLHAHPNTNQDIFFIKDICTGHGSEDSLG